MVKIKESIFRAYDIRGVYPKEISEEVAKKIGLGLMVFLRKKYKAGRRPLRIALGRDMRASSLPLSKSLSEGLASGRARIIDIGQVTTPMMNFAASYLSADGGVMVTASHNPKKYNGIKIVGRNSEQIGGEDSKKIFKATKTIKKIAARNIIVEKRNIWPIYLRAIAEGFSVKEKILARVGSGGGAAGLFLEELKNHLGLKNNGKPKFSASFDYDADRLIAGDEKGKKVRGDILGALLADTLLKQGDALVCDITCTRYVKEYFSRKGVRVFISPVGHFYIKREMRKRKAVFGMEMTGHYYFKNFNYAESSFYALRNLVEILSKNKNKLLSQLLKPFDKYFHSGILTAKKIDSKKLAEKIKKISRGGRITKIDGIRVDHPDWWFAVRPSNTEPVTRFFVEARSKKLMQEKKKELEGLLQK